MRSADVFLRSNAAVFASVLLLLLLLLRTAFMVALGVSGGSKGWGGGCFTFNAIRHCLSGQWTCSVPV
jgi:hypothetical protein